MIAACIIRQFGDNRNSLSKKIDATSLVPVLEVSTAYQEIMGGVHTHHKICTCEMSAEIINKIMDQKPSVPINVEKATEVKVTLMVFQNSSSGVSHIEMIYACPHF